MVTMIDSQQGMSQVPKGNVLPIELAYSAPSGEPPAEKGMVLVWTGSALVLYAWDPVGAAWRTN